MQSSEVNQQQAVSEIYNYVANLIVNEKKDAVEVRNVLAEKGLGEDAAYTIVKMLRRRIPHVMISLQYVTLRVQIQRKGPKKYPLFQNLNLN